MTGPSSDVPRRSFLRRASASALAIAASPGLLSAGGRQAAGPASAANPDAWLDGMTAPHRMIFDMPDMGGGIPPVHILNYLNSYNSAYSIADSDINAVATLYGDTTLLAVNDDMWAKYRLGELVDLRDPQGNHWTRNPWRTSVHAIGMDLEAASIETLQSRGVLFIACENALGFYIQMIAGARSTPTEAVDAEMRANLLPGVVLVPAMVVAIEKAQAHGLAYRKE